MIMDTNRDVSAHVPALKAAGVGTVIRYLNPLAPAGEKCIKPAEARAIAAAGLRLALVCEGWGDFAHGAISAGAGARDGEWCAHYAPTVGAPFGVGDDGNAACIYYAVDVDADAGQIQKQVLPYFRAARPPTVAAGFRVGVYGSGAVCANVLAAGLAELAWLSCSLGWSGSRAFLAAGRWALRQHVPQLIGGLDCDPNEASGDCGDFIPFAAPAPVAPPAKPFPPPPHVVPETSGVVTALQKAAPALTVDQAVARLRALADELAHALGR